MMAFTEARKAAVMLAALAEPTRLRIVSHLIHGPHHVGRLAELVGTPMVNMSHHLGVMRQAGLLEDEKDGRRVVYRFRPGIFAEADDEGNLGTLVLGPFRVVINANGDMAAKGKGKPRRKSGG
jgi:ArsR family transcriptional regulator